MKTLNFGVVDVPYGGKSDATTGTVADILEEKYHVMVHFYEAYADEIAELLSDGLAGTLESLLMGAPPRSDPYASGTEKIEELFRRFLSEQGLDGLGYPGIPTAASLKGVNHRLSHPYAKENPSRPSFIDTGLYETSMKVWVE